MTNYETGAVRDTGGKGRMDLLPMCALLRVSRHMENANTHYPERNWEKGLPMHSMLDSAFRHLAKYMDGQTDEDHLCAAATNLLMAMWTEEKRPSMQDIPTRLAKGSSLASGGESGTPIPPDSQAQEKAPLEPQTVCPYYDAARKVCMSTREMDPCSCGGDKRRCD